MVLRGGVILLAVVHLPGPVDGWNLSKASGSLFDITLYVGIVELALAAVVALACGLMLFLAGVVTAGDFRRIARKMTRPRTASDCDDVSLAALETIVGLRKPRRT